MLQQIKAAFRGSTERARHRRDYRALLQLEDHLLRDIGIPRDENPGADSLVMPDRR